LSFQFSLFRLKHIFQKYYFFIFLEGLLFSFGLNTYLKIEHPIVLAIFLASSTLLIYNLQYYIYNTISYNTILKEIYPISLMFVFSLFLFLRYITIDFNLILLLILLSLISLFYVFPKKYCLRNIPYIKPFIIAFVWVMIFVYLPLIIKKQHIPFLLIVFCYLFFFINTILFDIKDAKKDNNVLKSFPNQFSMITIKKGLLFLLVVLVFVSKKNELFRLTNINFYFFILFSMLIFLSIKNKMNDKFYYFSSFIMFFFISLAFYFN
jgi:hypothetical protein